MARRLQTDGKRLAEHSKTQKQIPVGTTVLVQNQTGRHPTKWDKTGMVLENQKHDKVLVRLDGSGRTTIRNRKYVREIPVTCATRTIPVPRPTGTVPIQRLPPSAMTEVPRAVPYFQESPDMTVTTSVPNDRAVAEVPAQVNDDQDVPSLPVEVRPIDDGWHEAVGDPVPATTDDCDGGARRSTRERRQYQKYGQDYDYDYDVSELFVPLKLALDLVTAAAC